MVHPKTGRRLHRRQERDSGHLYEGPARLSPPAPTSSGPSPPSTSGSPTAPSRPTAEAARRTPLLFGGIAYTWNDRRIKRREKRRLNVPLQGPGEVHHAPTNRSSCTAARARTARTAGGRARYRRLQLKSPSKDSGWPRAGDGGLGGGIGDRAIAVAASSRCSSASELLRHGHAEHSATRTTTRGARHAQRAGHPSSQERLELLDHVVDAARQRLNIHQVDRREHRDTTGCGRACRSSVSTMPLARRTLATAAASISSAKSIVPMTCERWPRPSRTGWRTCCPAATVPAGGGSFVRANDQARPPWPLIHSSTAGRAW